MKKYVLNVHNISKLYIYTNSKKISNKLLQKKSITKTIPAEIEYIGEYDNIIEDSNYILVLNNNIQNIIINKENNYCSLNVKENEFFFPDLVYLAICMLSNDLQKKQLYFVQSSVVKYDDTHSIMLLGDPNSGKTSMAYSLMKEYGYSLVSNDNVLINGNETICGTKEVQMRYGAMKIYFPEILPYISIPKEDEERSEWDTKIYINDYLKNNGFKEADKSVITDIYNISTYQNGNTFIKDRENVDKKLLIYENITKQIRSNRYVLVSMDYPIPSFENEIYMQERYSVAKKIAENTNVYDAKGTIKTLTKRIGDKYGK